MHREKWEGSALDSTSGRQERSFKGRDVICGGRIQMPWGMLKDQAGKSILTSVTRGKCRFQVVRTNDFF